MVTLPNLFHFVLKLKPSMNACMTGMGSKALTTVLLCPGTTDQSVLASVNGKGDMTIILVIFNCSKYEEYFIVAVQ